MSEPPRVMYQRTNANRVGVVSGPFDYVPIGSLPAQSVCNILAQTTHHSDFELSKIIAAEEAQTGDFGRYSKLVLNAFFTAQSSGLQAKWTTGLTDSQQHEEHEESPDVFSEVQDCIKAIGNAIMTHSSFCTKKRALETLRKIGKLICVCTGEPIGLDVTKQFRSDNCLEKTMLQIVESMTVEERKALLTQEFKDKLVELESLWQENIASLRS